MFGEPKDVDGECNARLFIADNYGDNNTTIRCQLASDHVGVHQEQFPSGKSGLVTITWTTDAREKCNHGCGQWDDEHRDASIKCPRNADDHEWSDCAYCHPDKEAKTCGKCSQAYYHECGHNTHCSGNEGP